MFKSYQSVYVTAYRWIFRNFGQGKLPQFKSLFNVSFLLIILLTTGLLLAQFMLHLQSFAAGTGTSATILLGAVLFLLLNHLVLLNNRWLKKLNYRMAALSRHNLNIWSVVMLINVIIICGFVLIIAR
ncbi:MAG: hypothetical protein JWP78_876 [Mucilaginibacter sp.]|nr:hypothetical protein [Mucilaginibacter sp.]